MAFIRELTPFKNSIYEVQDLEIELDKLQPAIDRLFKNDSSLIYRNNGKQTPNLYEIEPEFAALFDKLDEVAEEILVSWGIDKKPKLQLYFINKDENYAHSPSHCHINCALSGVFYVKVPEGSGWIEFERPDCQEYQFKIHNSNNPNTNGLFSINPHENMALLFPSHMKHRVGVSKLKDSESRISIAFDYVI